MSRSSTCVLWRWTVQGMPMREYFPWPPDIANRTSAEGALHANDSVVTSPHKAFNAAVKDGSVGAKREVHSEIVAQSDGNSPNLVCHPERSQSRASRR